MKLAKEYFEEELSGEPLTQDRIIELIKLVQLETAFEATVRCSKIAILKSCEEWELPEYAELPFNCMTDDYGNWVYIDRKPIFNVYKDIKKDFNL